MSRQHLNIEREKDSEKEFTEHSKRPANGFYNPHVFFMKIRNFNIYLLKSYTFSDKEMYSRAYDRITIIILEECVNCL